MKLLEIIKEKTAAAWLTHILRSDSVLIAKSFPVNSNARHLQFSVRYAQRLGSGKEVSQTRVSCHGTDVPSDDMGSCACG